MKRGVKFASWIAYFSWIAYYSIQQLYHYEDVSLSPGALLSAALSDDNSRAILAGR